MKFEIKNRFTGAPQFECELTADIEKQEYKFRLGFAIREALKVGATLEGASLRGATLEGADLEGASLRGANLEGANLRGANLEGAYLRGATLEGADLEGASLRDATLEGVNLRGANLEGADLEGASLRGVNLRGANLEGADLEGIKSEFLSKLALAKNEVLSLYDYLMRGKIDGSCYEGECACFCCTIAKVANENYQNLTNGLKPNADSATERWFLAIGRGDMPQNNQVSAITAEWMREFMDKEGLKYPTYEIIAIENGRM